MEREPKERIVFDESEYYGTEGEETAVEDLAERDGLTREEVRSNYTDTQIFERAMEIKEQDYGEEMEALAAFFDGRASLKSDFVNPYGGNHILVRGAAQVYYGTRTGIAVYEDFTHATDCSPSRFHLGNVFADCEIQKVWDENGSLHVDGSHHDGHVSVELRQLTDEGERLWGELAYGEYLPEEGISAMGRTYHEGDENQFVHDLWESDGLCAKPRYMEQAYGCKGEEWGEPVRSNKKDTDRNLYTGKWRVHLVMPGEHYGRKDAVTYDKEGADRHGMGLPLVEFYDRSQDPMRFPGGQFTGGRYYLTTLMGLDNLGTPLSKMTALSLDGGVPAWTVRGEELATVTEWLTTQYQALAGDMLENVRDWYMREFPSDDLGRDIRNDLTFVDVWTGLCSRHNIYETIGVGDSVIRERIFAGMAERIGCPYDTVFDKWLGRERMGSADRDAREGDYSLSGVSREMKRSESGLNGNRTQMDEAKAKDSKALEEENH